MKTLYLLRHAKASGELHIKDIDRPLNQRGYDDIYMIGKKLIEMNVKVDEIVSSPAVRTYSTALIIARSLNYDIEKISINRNFYESSMAEYIDEISQTGDKINSLLISGHNPVLSELYSTLLKASYHDMTTSSFAAIKLPVDSWQDFALQKAGLLFYITPQQFR